MAGAESAGKTTGAVAVAALVGAGVGAGVFAARVGVVAGSGIEVKDGGGKLGKGALQAVQIKRRILVNKINFVRILVPPSVMQVFKLFWCLLAFYLM
jgi:hypothetical protein